MTEPLLQSTGVELLDVRRIRLVEGPAPYLSPENEAAMNRRWAESVRANPHLFDGPVAACTGLDLDGPRAVVVTWVRTTYRHYALRRVPGAGLWPSLFVSVVQPVDDGRVVAGRMSATTAFPGRWQLPGGSMEPPAEGETLDLAALRRHAARELVEEVGVEARPEELRLWLVSRGDERHVGAVFVAPSLPAPVLWERYAALVASETARGQEPELDRLALVRSPDELAELGGNLVDYLEPIVRRYAAR
ncbi:ADP-ribose pyrophosphatase YjhB, NUDIX family [Nonomuraea maritima]|uniref:ADP-ribose pyrophosphatase YjhB, NUDIX family n=1 Tax=Nonomuraea maritima TaxID=683260 RepID=A0A1G9J5D8_9ACTN|nr:NUDIX hydrolase [Nonomuraea maritima]SDL32456.1 ADP-ribose pyrophosphatase YjhB, NUDIX family [Nonomuraea maritima]